MKFLRFVFVAALWFAVLPARAQTPDAHLATVLAQMDKASAEFKSARADVSQSYYERVSKDTTTESGSVYFERKGGSTQMGLVTLDPGGKSKHQVIEFNDGVLRIFDVPNDQIRVIKAGPNQGIAETFLTLGFGGSGKALAQAWEITDQGSETLLDGGQPVKTEKLVLVSKDAKLRNTFTQVTIWVDPVRDVSLKQVFDTPSNDKRTATYSRIKVNGGVDLKYFAIKKDSKTTVVGP
ncbi:MAG TPA: outer membrane lipoprotein-sorting protein [Acidobacteriaceae bacterium]|nr:outer membrane lipoprotein-sorting protein [Acidobacteriaceae bacterium]